MTPLDLLYRKMLTLALINIRNLCDAGFHDIVRVEIEHIHNIPSLFGELNRFRHDYYIQDERIRYIDAIMAMDNSPAKEFSSRFYAPLWKK
jgi:hypothetical protein